MKKSLLICIAIFLSQFLSAQSSLDSLRLVVPEISRIDYFGLSKTGKFIYLVDDDKVYILESKSEKVIWSFFHEDGGYIANVDFNYNDDYLIVTIGWQYESIIYSLRTGEIIRRVNLGDKNIFCFFLKNENSFIYSPSFAFEDSISFIIEGITTHPNKDSLLLHDIDYPDFDGTNIIYTGQDGKQKCFDVIKKQFVDCESIQKDSLPIVNDFVIDSTKYVNKCLEPLIWRPFMFIDYDESKKEVNFSSNNPKKHTSISFASEFNIHQNLYEDTPKISGYSREYLEEIRRVRKNKLELIRVTLACIDSIELEFGFNSRGVKREKIKRFNFSKINTICRNGNFLALSYFDKWKSRSTVLLLSKDESDIVRVNQIFFNKKIIEQIYNIDKSGDVFCYRAKLVSSNSLIQDSIELGVYKVSTSENFASEPLEQSFADSLLFTGNDEVDAEVFDLESIIFFNKHYSQISLEETTFSLFNFKTNKLENLDINRKSIICDFLVQRSKNIILTLSETNTISVFSLKDFCLKIQVQLLADNNYIIKLPNSPYYMCSKDASKMLHYVTPSLKVIGFDQLDPVYNRPDIVLDSIGKYFGGSDKDLVANYRAAWEKRIDRLGLDKDKLSSGEIAVPNAEITNANEIKYENKDGKVIIHVKANDPKYPLRRYNVLVNEVPIYGADGISIAALNTQSWEQTDTIALSIGSNKIQVSVMNELGLENFKYPTYVNYSPAETVSAKTYYVGIGVNHFKEASHDLKYCVKDVQDLAKAFSKNQTQVDTLIFTDREVTKENILALKSYLQENTTVNDKVIISCSSHGLLDDSLNFYLATHDVDFKNPRQRGLKYEELESLLDGIPARQKLLLLDACNSGENECLFVERNKNSDLVINDPNRKGVELEIANNEVDTFKKMNELFVNVRNNTGSVIISAAGGLQSALEAIEVDGKEIKNGAFTYSVLEYLSKEFYNQERCTVNGMKNYVERRVEEITNGKQKPTSRQETMEVDWGIQFR